MTMKIAVGADHAGVPLNETVITELKRLAHEVVDCGTHDPSKPDDYPDYAEAVGRAVLEGKAERAVLICGSGVGASVAANKLPGIRAALCHDCYSAHQGVEHDNMNVLCLGSRVIRTGAGIGLGTCVSRGEIQRRTAPPPAAGENYRARRARFARTKMSGNPLLQLHALGQSIWLDQMSRSLLTTGGLKRLIDQDGLPGGTRSEEYT